MENLKIKNINGNYASNSETGMPVKQIINTKGLPELQDLAIEINRKFNEEIPLKKSVSKYKYSLASILFQGSEHIKLSNNRLNNYDIAVFNAIVNICAWYKDEPGERFQTTPLQIYQQMTQNFKLNDISEKNQNLIYESIRKLALIWVKIQCPKAKTMIPDEMYTQAYKYIIKRSGKLQIEGQLIKVTYISDATYIKGQKVGNYNHVYEIDKDIPIAMYATFLKEILYIPESWYKVSKGRNSSIEYMLLLEYILTMVKKRERMNLEEGFLISYIHKKDDKGLYSRLGYKWDFETGKWSNIYSTDSKGKVIEKTRWADKNLKIRKEIKNILDHLKKLKVIYYYEEERTGRYVTGIRVWIQKTVGKR